MSYRLGNTHDKICFSEKSREPFVTLKDIIVKLLPKWGYNIGPKTAGYSEADRSDEYWSFQYVHSSGQEVFHYEFGGTNGNYIGKLRSRLPEPQHQELMNNIEPIINSLSSREKVIK